MVQTAEEKARELRRQYKREWRKKNKDRVKQYNDNYWAKKVREAEQLRKEREGSKDDE